jgi:glycosyltransferase involved in cell wall biosynthesis
MAEKMVERVYKGIMLRKRKKIAVIVDQYSPEFMNKEMVTFARMLSDSMELDGWVVSNATSSNQGIGRIHKTIKLVRLQIPVHREWPPLHHWRYYLFLLSNGSRIGCVWLYRGRKYVLPTVLWSKLIGAKSVIRLDGINGVSWLSKRLYDGRQQSKRSSRLRSVKVNASRDIALSVWSKCWGAIYRGLNWLKNVAKALLDFLDRDLPLILADAILVETPEVTKSLKPLHVEAKCILFVNGPSASLMAETSLTTTLTAKANFILAVGRIRPSKGFTYLLRAFASLPKAIRSEWPLIIVGSVEDEDYREEMSKLILSLGVADSVQLRSAVYGIDLYDLLRQSSIFVLPSISGEGQPNIVTEAMYFKCAVIATQVGTVPFQLDYGRAGVLVEPMNVLALSNALAEVIQNDSLRKALSKRAEERACNDLSPDKSMSVLIQMIFPTTVPNRAVGPSQEITTVL